MLEPKLCFYLRAPKRKLPYFEPNFFFAPFAAQFEKRCVGLTSLEQMRGWLVGVSVQTGKGTSRLALGFFALGTFNT